MSIRYPSIPLITHDPYFSVWSHDLLNDKPTYHWTAKNNEIRGTVTVDGEKYRFIGSGDEKAMTQISVKVTALSSEYIFEGADIRLSAVFTSPVMADKLYLVSRPITYLALSYESISGVDHKVSATVACSEQLVLNTAGESPCIARERKIKGVTAISLENSVQNPLNKCGDDLRIDWGVFYLAVKGDSTCYETTFDGMKAVAADFQIDNIALVLFAYDDIESIEYFGKHLFAYWKKDGKTITEAIADAAAEYDTLSDECRRFSEELYTKAENAGGSEYAELLSLAYRQVIAAHKLVVNDNGENLFISKECFSNGCAATVDVTYPSAPMLLYYNTELLKATLRPVFEFAASDAWQWDFAPHDVGTYPLLNGQVYGVGDIKFQMPVEESGNILILVSEICRRDGNCEFAEKYADMLQAWSVYLEKFGRDPENQLCTDDFAGHMPHNVNLAIKACMGLAGYADILKAFGNEKESERIANVAKSYADDISLRAANGDGSTKLAFDIDGSFSLKYNAVWDKLWKKGLFSNEFYQGEIKRYKKEALTYGVPLDSREKYTKSDWELWAACLSDNDGDFKAIVKLMYAAYNEMKTRVPLTDWYRTDIADMVGFRHRSVQGGLFMKLLFE